VDFSRSVTILAFGLGWALSSTGVQAESFSEWKKNHQQQTNEWFTAQQAAFADMLRDEWASFESHLSRREGYQPKPSTPPSVSPQPDLPEPPPAVRPEPEPTVPEPAPDQALRFLGHELTPPEWQTRIPATYKNSSDFADAWETLARAPTTELVVSWLERQQNELALGDWGTWKLVRKIADGTAQQQAVRTWYLLLALGYDVKLGFSQDRVAVLPRVSQTIYWKQYYTRDGHRYYDLARTESRTGQLFLHGDLDEARKAMDLSLRQHPETRPDPRRLSLIHGKTTLNLEFDQELASFYHAYPTIDLIHYFDAPLDPLLQTSLREAWNSLSNDGLGDLDRLNLLLGLVQHGIRYQLDSDLFGIEEYYQLPGELLQNGAGDCEDRSILFARMVRHLMNRDIVGVRYPGHVATAVRLEGTGISYLLDNQNYLVADPTYIGSVAGEAIPDLAKETPELIY
jgi:hypothetical protein